MRPRHFDWRKVSSWLFVLIVVGFAAYAGRLLFLRIKAQANRAGGPVPYTVILKEIVHGANGSTTSGVELTQAVRSDGSTVRRIAHKEKEPGSSERTVNFSSGVEVAINELANTKTSMMKSSLNSAAWQRDPGSKCINSFAGKPMTSMPETFAGEETVAGYRTAKIASKTITAWYALDYGCALVKDRWDFETGEMSEKQLVALVAGEPDSRLFEVPANAREVPPSERLFGPSKQCTGCDAHAMERIRKLDEEYNRLAVKPR